MTLQVDHKTDRERQLERQVNWLTAQLEALDVDPAHTEKATYTVQKGDAIELTWRATKPGTVTIYVVAEATGETP